MARYEGWSEEEAPSTTGAGRGGPGAPGVPGPPGGFGLGVAVVDKTHTVTLECDVEFEGEKDLETEKDTERMLITLVAQHRGLWHHRDPDYCNKRRKDELWADIARQLPYTGCPPSPEWTRRKWQALRDASAKARERGGGRYEYSHLMSFLDNVDEFSEQYIGGVEEDPVEENPLIYDSSAEPQISRTEKPKKQLNSQRIQHTIRRFQHGLDPPNPQSEYESDSEAILRRPEDGHTHFCLSLAPLMRSLPLQQVVGVRIKILQLLRDAMAVECV